MDMNHSSIQIRAPGTPPLPPRSLMERDFLLPYPQATQEDEDIKIFNRYVLKQNLNLFWRKHMMEILNIRDSKKHPLPLERIRRKMKANQQVKLVSSESPILLSKACEFLIMELTLRTWLKAEEKKRIKLLLYDLEMAVSEDQPLHCFLNVIQLRQHQVNPTLNPIQNDYGYEKASEEDECPLIYELPFPSGGFDIEEFFLKNAELQEMLMTPSETPAGLNGGSSSEEHFIVNSEFEKLARQASKSPAEPNDGSALKEYCMENPERQQLQMKLLKSPSELNDGSSSMEYFMKNPKFLQPPMKPSKSPAELNVGSAFKWGPSENEPVNRW